MANDTTGHAHSAPGTGPDTAVSALMAAVQMFVTTLAGDVPFGAAGTVLERMKAVREQIDKLTFSMLGPLAQMEASGELLAEGGQKNLKAYVTHAWGIGPNEAERLMYLARNLHHGTTPQTAVAIEAGALTVGEAAAVAAGVEREVTKRDTNAHPDADEYRAKMDTGMMVFKDHKASMSVKNFDQAARALGFGLNPDRPEKDEQAQFTARGARLRSSFAGFSFEAWGPVSDGERLKAALASFMAPYGTTDKNPDDNGTGADGAEAAAFGGSGSAGGSAFDFIPPGEAVTTRSARTYDALICAMGFAHGHHGHTNPSGTGSAAGTGGGGDGYGTGTETDADYVGDTDTDRDGPGGFASGGADGTADDVAASDSGGGATSGCTEPPGTKAVINITVPLSALLGFGFAFNNDTDANGVGNTNTLGATGSPPGSGPGSGAGSGPDPGGSGCTCGGDTTAGSTTTASNTGPPGFPGYTGNPASPGPPVSSGLAVTEDGTVLALSAVRAMAPTAQIRRLIFDDNTGLPLDLGRAHRLAPGYLRTAAFAGHTTCAWSGGCDVPVSQCEADHITEFTHGGTTTATNLQPLCSTHNRLKYRRTRTENTPNGTAGAPGA